MKPRKSYHIDEPAPWQWAIALGLMLALILSAAAGILYSFPKGWVTP